MQLGYQVHDPGIAGLRAPLKQSGQQRLSQVDGAEVVRPPVDLVAVKQVGLGPLRPQVQVNPGVVDQDVDRLAGQRPVREGSHRGSVGQVEGVPAEAVHGPRTGTDQDLVAEVAQCCRGGQADRIRAGSSDDHLHA
jgi:hypothetical protein